jgi:hypothetical protein
MQTCGAWCGLGAQRAVHPLVARGAAVCARAAGVTVTRTAFAPRFDASSRIPAPGRETTRAPFARTR